MKLSVKCLVSSVNAGELPEAESVVKDITLSNPNATLLNLRAAASVQFRVQVHGFRMVYRGERPGVDLSDEKKTVSEAGLQDGDAIVLVSKRARETGETGDNAFTDGAPATTHSTMRFADPLREESHSEHSDNEEASFHSGDGDDDDDGFDVTDLDDVGNGELYGRILEVTPNIIAMREEFLQDPRALMERIQREDPSLFQLITSHQEDFVSLINDEVLVHTLQQEKEAQQAFLDEELDEEQEEALFQMLAQQIQDEHGAVLSDGDVDADEDDLVDTEENADSVAAPSSDKDRILAFVPPAEDESKIQDLTQLGFTYEQSKLAFYICHRSVERAANMLFESPPAL